MSTEAMKLALEALEEPHPGIRTSFTDAITYREKVKQAITTLQEALAQPQDFSDAYQGAREDLAIWKKRALEAEELNRKFIADINGQTFMGEPAQQEPVAWANPNDLQNFDLKVRTNGGPLHTVPLYISPPAQEIVCSTGLCHYRKPLTDEEMYLAIRPLFRTDAFANAALELSKDEYQAIEAAHGIKGDA